MGISTLFQLIGFQCTLVLVFVLLSHLFAFVIELEQYLGHANKVAYKQQQYFVQLALKAHLLTVEVVKLAVKL